MSLTESYSKRKSFWMDDAAYASIIHMASTSAVTNPDDLLRKAIIFSVLKAVRFPQEKWCPKAYLFAEDIIGPNPHELITTRQDRMIDLIVEMIILGRGTPIRPKRDYGRAWTLSFDVCQLAITASQTAGRA